MGDACSLLLHAVVVTSYIISAGANFGAIFGYSWWKNLMGSSSSLFTEEIGIIRSCFSSSVHQQSCYYREDILKFGFLKNNQDLIPDIILVLFILASTFVCIALFVSLVLCLKRIKRKTWRIGTVVMSTLGLFGSLCNFGGTIYAQLASNNLSGYAKSWTFVLAWVAAGVQLIGVFVTYTLLCFPPKCQDGGVVTVRYDNSQKVQNKSGHDAFSKKTEKMERSMSYQGIYDYQTEISKEKK